VPMNLKTCAFITINQQGIILSVDLAAGNMFGYLDAEELIGKNVSILVPPPYKVCVEGGFSFFEFPTKFFEEQHDSYLRSFNMTGVKHIMGTSRDVEAQHKDGSIFAIKLSLSAGKNVDETVYVGSVEKIASTSTVLKVSLVSVF
jgi:two-component system sensor kinase FixL